MSACISFVARPGWGRGGSRTLSVLGEWGAELFSGYVWEGGTPSFVYLQNVSQITTPTDPRSRFLGPHPLEGEGPCLWGSAQFSINIDLHTVQCDPTLGSFIFQSYDSAPPGPRILNNGHIGQQTVRTELANPHTSRVKDPTCTGIRNLHE